MEQVVKKEALKILLGCFIDELISKHLDELPLYVIATRDKFETTIGEAICLRAINELIVLLEAGIKSKKYIKDEIFNRIIQYCESLDLEIID